MQIPQNPPKFNIGDHVIPTNVFDREEFPEGYVIGLISLGVDGDPEWVCWGKHEYRHVDGWVLSPGFAEQHLELYKENE